MYLGVCENRASTALFFLRFSHRTLRKFEGKSKPYFILSYYYVRPLRQNASFALLWTHLYLMNPHYFGQYRSNLQETPPYFNLLYLLSLFFLPPK